MRVKLGLTETELMNKSWIALNIEMSDYPYWDYSGKKVVKGKAASDYLQKFIT
jgi:hypothetical protein